jgi:hypothetical protein
MEHNGASNGQDALPQTSPTTAGVSKSPRKRRKVNHGMLWCQRLRMYAARPPADRRTCSCSLCILSTICKSPIGLEHKNPILVDAPMRDVWRELIRSVSGQHMTCDLVRLFRSINAATVVALKGSMTKVFPLHRNDRVHAV